MGRQEKEIDLMLECASKVRKHLERVVDEKKELALRLKLNYVDEIIHEADSLKKEIASYS